MNKKNLETIEKALSEQASLLVTAPNEKGEAFFNINVQNDEECKTIAASIVEYTNNFGPNSKELINIILNAASIILQNRPLIKKDFLKNIQA